MLLRLGPFMSILLIATITTGPTHADVFDDAARALGPYAPAIRRVSVAQHAGLQRYFAKLNAKLDYPDEVTRPRPTVILIDAGEGSRAGLVVPGHPEFLFWNLRFLIASPSADVDLFMLSYLRRHYDEVDPSHDARLKDTLDWANYYGHRIEREHLDMFARLFRIGLRDPVTQQPTAAPFHAKSVLKFIKSPRGRAYFARSVVPLEVPFSLALQSEQSIRSFKKTKSPRPELDPELLKMKPKQAPGICERLLSRVKRAVAKRYGQHPLPQRK